jgi:hypothetical protein
MTLREKFSLSKAARQARIKKRANDEIEEVAGRVEGHISIGNKGATTFILSALQHPMAYGYARCDEKELPAYRQLHAFCKKKNIMIERGSELTAGNGMRPGVIATLTVDPARPYRDSPDANFFFPQPVQLKLF